MKSRHKQNLIAAAFGSHAKVRWHG